MNSRLFAELAREPGQQFGVASGFAARPTLAGFIHDFQSVDVGVQILDRQKRYGQFTQGVWLQTMKGLCQRAIRSTSPLINIKIAGQRHAVAQDIEQMRTVAAASILARAEQFLRCIDRECVASRRHWNNISQISKAAAGV